VARAVGVVAEVVPAGQPAGTYPDGQMSTPPANGDDNPDDAVTTGPAPDGDAGRHRTRRGRGRSTAQRVAQVLAKRPDATPAQVAARLGVSERTAQRHWPDRTGRNVNGRAGLPELAALHAGHPPNGSNTGREES
jgi:hypothetical protein